VKSTPRAVLRAIRFLPAVFSDGPTRGAICPHLSSLCHHFVITLSATKTRDNPICHHFVTTLSSLCHHFVARFVSVPLPSCETPNVSFRASICGPFRQCRASNRGANAKNATRDLRVC
jgi:hypothetical protein